MFEAYDRGPVHGTPALSPIHVAPAAALSKAIRPVAAS